MRPIILERTQLPEQIVDFMNRQKLTTDFQALTEDGVFILHIPGSKGDGCSLWTMRIIDGLLWVLYTPSSAAGEYQKSISEFVHSEIDE